jgi:aldehyde:ferredoxin oxidoreductase
MYEWTETLLRVDLSKGEVVKEPIPREFLVNYIGGEGLGVRLLYDEVPPGTDPLAPEMALIVAAGPLSGTLAPGSGRLEIVTKSPITGIFGDSNAGDDFAPELHWAGYEAILIKGRAENPVYLWIDDDVVQIRDAHHLWGRPHAEAIDMVKQELGDPEIRTIAVGPAAEKGVLVTAIYSGYSSAAGWPGVGSVMAAKNLKLIAVRGSQGVEVADPARFERACWESNQKMISSTLHKQWSQEGALGVANVMYGHIGALPVRNFQDSYVPPEELHKVDYQGFSQHKVKDLACFGCPLHCKHFTHVKSGPYAGVKMKGVEYWASNLFGPNLGCFDAAFYIKCVEECDRYGMDIGNTGMLLSLAAELYQRGIITQEDTGGLDLTWGNQQENLEMIRRIANREGLGDLLAQGVDKAAQAIGKNASRYTVTYKGLSGCLEHRFYVGSALAHLTSTRGGDMLKGNPNAEQGEGMLPKLSEKYAREYFDIPSLHPEATEGKDKVVIYMENLESMVDSVPGCLFNSVWGLGLRTGLNQDDYAKMLSAATGVEFDGDRVLRSGERIYRLEMAYNVREGLRREHFKMPERFLNDPIASGPLKGKVADATTMERLLDSYFQRRGFDPRTALPTRKGLEETGLADVAQDLEERGLLAPDAPSS